METIDYLKAMDCVYADKEREDERIESLFDRYISEEDHGKRRNLLIECKKKYFGEYRRLHHELLKINESLLAAQPPLKKLTAKSLNTGDEYPRSISVGAVKFRCPHADAEEESAQLTIPFPFEKTLTLAKPSRIAPILLRMMQCVPTGRLRITVIDPKGVGTSVEPLLGILREKSISPYGRVLTTDSEIEAALDGLNRDLVRVTQHVFGNTTKNWMEYNEKHPSEQLPCQILAVFDAPMSLTDQAVRSLSRLIEHGPRCGIFPLLSLCEHGKDTLEGMRYADLASQLEKYADSLESIITMPKLLRMEAHSVFKKFPEDVQEFLECIAQEYESRTRFSKTLVDLLDGPMWEGNATDEVSAPIGWNREGLGRVTYAFGDNHPPHALLGGKSGSGKSNLLHVLIHSLCHSYGPDELKIFLLDYKQGVEFNAYANPILPHAALVATQSDAEYGCSVLKHLLDELESRAEKFKQAGVNDYTHYRRRPGISLPRILLIVDEFQIMLPHSITDRSPASDYLQKILRQGRAYGIHVLLSTQTLKGIEATNIGEITSQLGCRIALSCNEDDSMILLSQSNTAAATLKMAEEGIINTQNGIKKHNVVLLIPLADDVYRKKHLALLSNEAAGRGWKTDTKIFSGASLPLLEPEQILENGFSHSENPAETVQLKIGTELTYEAAPFHLSLASQWGCNLLVCGADERILQGLHASILISLSASHRDVYYVGEAPKGVPELSNVHFVGATTDLPLKILCQDMPPKIAVLFGDILGEVGLRCAAFQTPKKDTPVAWLQALMEQGCAKGIHVVSFARSYKQLSSHYKYVCDASNLRIGFRMNAGETTSFFNGASLRSDAMTRGDMRALFYDCNQMKATWFRPYAFAEVDGSERISTLSPSLVLEETADSVPSFDSGESLFENIQLNRAESIAAGNIYPSSDYSSDDTYTKYQKGDFFSKFPNTKEMSDTAKCQEARPDDSSEGQCSGVASGEPDTFTRKIDSSTPLEKSGELKNLRIKETHIGASASDGIREGNTEGRLNEQPERSDKRHPPATSIPTASPSGYQRPQIEDDDEDAW